MSATMDRRLARYVIETVGAHGTPPEWGFQTFSIGLDETLSLLDDEYLASYIPDGGSSFKLVVGSYGGGKTHFLYSVREQAFERGHAVAYVPLSADEAPFHRLERVYRSIVRSLSPPLTPDELLSGAERGVRAFLKLWLQRAEQELSEVGVAEEQRAVALRETAVGATSALESTNFAHAVRGAFTALAEGRQRDFEALLQWLEGEGYDRARLEPWGILRPIDRSTAFASVRSLVQWIRALGYSGLVILFDEAEQIPSLSSRERDLALSNLREVIDACGHASFQGAMIFYAIPDEAFFEGATHVYEALRQRIATVFDFYNPSGVRIRLDEEVARPEERLTAIGERLRGVFEAAYQTTLPDDEVSTALAHVARAAYGERFGAVGYTRLFVQAAVRTFQLLRRRPETRIDAAAAERIVAGERP